MRAFAVVILLLAACETPPLTLKFRITDGDAQQCIGDTGNETTSCADITMECDAVLSIRIVPPNEPEVPYVSVCEPVQSNQRKLCSIAGIPLPQANDPIPEQVLEIQMAVFPRHMVPVVDGRLQCPIVQFGVDGLPVEQVCSSADTTSCPGRPAVGGRAFYHPGDEKTVVKLGCTELELLRGEMCSGLDRTEVVATVNEFEAPASVDLVTANRMFVAIGEPLPVTATSYALDSSRAHSLPRDPTASLPTWYDEIINLELTSTYCIEALEDAPLATRTLTCRQLPVSGKPPTIDANGTRLKPETLATILKAANLTTFPARGLVVGIVLNASFAPVPNAVVTAPCATLSGPERCTIKYLSQDKLSFNTSATSSNGIWISEDAPYGTVFSRSILTPTSAFGGIVDNKVTIVVLQESGLGN